MNNFPKFLTYSFDSHISYLVVLAGDERTIIATKQAGLVLLSVSRLNGYVLCRGSYVPFGTIASCIIRRSKSSLCFYRSSRVSHHHEMHLSYLARYPPNAGKV